MSKIMGTLVQRTTDVRNAADKASMLSLENDIVELTEQVDSDVADVNEVSGQITEANDNIETSTTGVDSLSSLVDNTIAIYGEQGIPEDAAKQLEVSVEAILRVMGHPGGFTTVLPSFESCATPASYSTEAEEKKNGVVARIWEWIKKIYDNLSTFVTTMVSKIRNSSATMKKLTEKLKQKVDGLNGKAPEGEISLGKSDSALIHPGNTSGAIHDTGAAFKGFVKKWEDHFGGVFEHKLGKNMQETDFETVIEFMGAVTHKLSIVPTWDKAHVTAFHEIVVTKGTDAEYPVIGAKVKIEAPKPAAATKVYRLTVEQMKAGISAAEACLKEIDEAATSFERWKENLKVVKTLGNGSRTAGTAGKIIGGKEHAAEAEKAIKAGKAMQGMAHLGTEGMQQSIPAVLAVLRANLIYINKSAGGYGGAEAKPAEAKADA